MKNFLDIPENPFTIRGVFYWLIIPFIIFFIISFFAGNPVRASNLTNLTINNNNQTKTYFDEEFKRVEIQTQDTKLTIKRSDSWLQLELINDIDTQTNIEYYPVENGYEMEIDLLNAPASNEIIFSLINSPDLFFSYQPELTQEEIDKGFIRPLNVIGSYAIFSTDRKGTTGKIGHIYRPQIIDSAGKTTWGDLFIDDALGFIRITIPEEFLKNAVFPIHHVAGLTFGYTTIGASYTGMQNNANVMVFELPADALLESMSLYLTEVDGIGGGNFRFAVYESDGTNCTNLIEESGPHVGAGGSGWQTFDFSGTTELGSGYYCLASQVSNGRRFYYDTGTGILAYYHTQSFDAFIDPFTSDGNQVVYSMYANYTEIAEAEPEEQPAYNIASSSYLITFMEYPLILIIFMGLFLSILSFGGSIIKWLKKLLYDRI